MVLELGFLLHPSEWNDGDGLIGLMSNVLGSFQRAGAVAVKSVDILEASTLGFLK